MEIFRQAVDRVIEIMARPLHAAGDEGPSSDEFDPWEIFTCLYGSYSSDFDDMAIKVLENLMAQTNEGESLPHEMFREMLCTANLCDYGTSPRVCFPTSEFREVLPELLKRWKEYRTLMWGA